MQNRSATAPRSMPNSPFGMVDSLAFAGDKNYRLTPVRDLLLACILGGQQATS